MSRLDREEQCRRDGMMYALKIAQQKGVEGLEQEVKMRNICKASLAIPTPALNEFIGEAKACMMDTIMIVAYLTLMDEFGFGSKRLQRFRDRFNLKANCLTDDLVTWDDYINAIKQETGLQLKVRWFDRQIRI